MTQDEVPPSFTEEAERSGGSDIESEDEHLHNDRKETIIPGEVIEYDGGEILKHCAKTQ